jgi:microtubule-associated protein-like 6
VATGEVGKNPKICIWDSSNPEGGPLAEFSQGRGTRGVTCLSFSACGKYVAAADLHNDHNVRVWDWQAKKQVAEDKGGPDKILDC